MMELRDHAGEACHRRPPRVGCVQEVFWSLEHSHGDVVERGGVYNGAG